MEFRSLEELRDWHLALADRNHKDAEQNRLHKGGLLITQEHEQLSAQHRSAVALLNTAISNQPKESNG